MEWSTLEVRRLLRALCPTDADFNAFVLNHFPDVHRRFSDGMEGLQKENLLIQLSGKPTELALALREHAGDPKLFEREAKRAQAGAEPTRVLVVAANPEVLGHDRLSEGREIRAIREALRVDPAGAAGSFALEVRTAVTPDDLRRALLDICPNVLHFSGHGDLRPMPELLFEDARGEPKPVGAEALRDLLGLFGRELRLVVLNACHGRDPARVIALRVDCAIGVHGEIDDEEATLFAGGLYQGIEAGRSVRESFALGCNAIPLDGSRSSPRLELFVREGVDARDVSFGRARGPQRVNSKSSR